MQEKNETATAEQKDWDIAVYNGQYSQGEDREDLVTFRRNDLAAYIAQIREDAVSELMPHGSRRRG